MRLRMATNLQSGLDSSGKGRRGIKEREWWKKGKVNLSGKEGMPGRQTVS